MVIANHFCPNCGKPTGFEDRFCRSCGHSLALSNEPAISPNPPPPSLAPPPLSSPQPAAAILEGAEEVIGVISASRKSGMFSQEGFHIVVTARRLVFAAFTNDMLKQAAKDERRSGFLSGMMGAMTLGYTYYKRYLSMSPEVALKENPQNFAVDRAKIRKIKLDLGKRQTDRNRHVDVYEPSRLEIETAGEKYVFSVPNHFHEMESTVLRQAGLG